MSNAVLIVPLSDLKMLPSEAQEVLNNLSRGGYSVRQLISPVTQEGLYRSATDGSYDLVWLGTHSTSTGFLLSNEELLTPRALTQYLSVTGATELVMVSCFSAEHVEAIQSWCPQVTIVAGINPLGLDDQDGWRFSSYLSLGLSKGMSLEDAYRDAAANGSTQFRLFPAAKGADMVNGVQDKNNLGQVERLMLAIEGSPTMGIKGLVRTIEELSQAIEQNNTMVKEWQMANERRYRQLEEDLAAIHQKIKSLESPESKYVINGRGIAVAAVILVVLLAIAIVGTVAMSMVIR